MLFCPTKSKHGTRNCMSQISMRTGCRLSRTQGHARKFPTHMCWVPPQRPPPAAVCNCDSKTVRHSWSRSAHGRYRLSRYSKWLIDPHKFWRRKSRRWILRTCLGKVLISWMPCSVWDMLCSLCDMVTFVPTDLWAQYTGNSATYVHAVYSEPASASHSCRHQCCTTNSYRVGAFLQPHTTCSLQLRCLACQAVPLHNIHAEDDARVHSRPDLLWLALPA